MGFQFPPQKRIAADDAVHFHIQHLLIILRCVHIKGKHPDSGVMHHVHLPVSQNLMIGIPGKGLQART